MQVTVENTSSIGRKVSIIVPAQTLEDVVQSKLKNFAKTAKMQGFRPGKVPMKVVEQQYRGSATSEAMGEVVQSTLFEALEKKDIKPAVQPDIDPQELEKGKDFTYIATFDVQPEFKKLDLDGVAVKKPVSSITDTDVDKVIENMRKQQISWNEVTRKAKKEDRVIVDFNGQVDGEDFEGGKANDYPIVIGEGQMLPDFEKGVTGMKAGETKEIKVTFPDDYAEAMAGKKAVFTIEAKTVSESALPEINEEFIKSFAIESGKEADLRTEVTKNLEATLETHLNSMSRERVFDALLEQNDVELPAKMVTEECQRMAQEQKNQMLQQGLDAKMLEGLPAPDLALFEEQAKKRVELGMVMMEIINKQEIKPDEKRVEAKIQKMSETYQDPQEVITYYQTNQQALAQVQSVVLEEQVVDFLLEKAQVKDEKLVASDILNMQ